VPLGVAAESTSMGIKAPPAAALRWLSPWFAHLPAEPIPLAARGPAGRARAGRPGGRGIEQAPDRRRRRGLDLYRGQARGRQRGNHRATLCDLSSWSRMEYRSEGISHVRSIIGATAGAVKPLPFTPRLCS
jgi:hypothetical protein